MMRLRVLLRGLSSAGALALGVISFLPINLSVAADFFVRGNGDDSAPGASRRTAWRSIERVNCARFHPGDRVLFQAGQSFSGNLRLTAEDAGNGNAPVVIGSFGLGRATILAGGGTGISIENAGGITIENMVVIGAGVTNNTGYGVFCDNSLTNAAMLVHIAIRNVEVSGFGKHGILVSGAPAGFRHVRISRCVMRENLLGGMEIAGRLPWDAPKYAHADVEVTDCQAFDNPGDPNYHKNHSGSGIVLYEVDGGLMDSCSAWNNGGWNGSAGGGPVGLWTCASRGVTIQHCESFGNHTQGADGGGFDIDGGSEDCVLQYNYSHDNDGPGLMVYTYAYASHTDRANVVRFNISENDSRRSRTYAGLWVRNDGNGMQGVEVYNNTVLAGPWTEQAASIYGEGVDAIFRNNIFIAGSSATPLRVHNPHGKLRFENNIYWANNGPAFPVVWGKEPYGSLDEWRDATGQESLDGRPFGFVENPKLNVQPYVLRSGKPVHPAKPRSFRPLPGSPARKGGLNLQGQFGIRCATNDFGGNTLLGTGPWPVGAFAR